MKKHGSIWPKRLLAVLLAVSLVLSVTACGGGTEDRGSPTPSQSAIYSEAEKQQEQTEFLSLCDEFLLLSFQAEPYSVNPMVQDPEKLGLDSIDAGTWGDLSQAENEDPQQAQLISRLEAIEPQKLTKDQQRLYAEMKSNYLDNGQEADSDNLYENYFDTTAGVQAGVSAMLKAYVFRNETDVKNYLRLLKGIPDFFASALAQAEKQAQQDLLPNDIQLDRAIEQCDGFLENQKDHYLTTSFEKRLEQVDFLTKAEKAAYKKQNKALMETYYFPAYQSLKASLTEMKNRDDDQRSDRLCDTAGGKAYYAQLVRSRCSTDTPPEELQQKLIDYLDDIVERAQQTAEEPTPSLPVVSSDVKGVLNFIETAMEDDYPAMPQVRYEAEKMDKAEQEGNNILAYFQQPPIDGQETMKLYFGENEQENPVEAVTTIFHEGIPGHMYEAAYQSQHSVHPLENLLSLSCLGRTEGWATYVEIDCLQDLNLSKQQQSQAENQIMSIQALTDICDIGFHYVGWSKEDVYRLLETCMGTDQYNDALYQSIVSSPGDTLCYTVGYLEMLELKAQAKALLGDQYTDKLFHTFVMDSGAQTFPVLQEMLREFAAQPRASAEKAA
ncbi:MAG: DUF885 domain-containing protein [Oscillospiraceae bacterium]|nr:DUF885 domain-containing protein [Oscillospiraceae bacterium]